MRNKALVSVIMPLLNAEPFIRRKPIGTTRAVFGVADMGSSKESALLDRTLKLKDAVFPNFALLSAYLVIRNGAVPAHNELVYLLYLAKQWNPNLLSNDWTFSGPL